MNLEQYNKEKDFYTLKMKAALAPIMGEIIDLQDEDVYKPLLLGSVLDVFISFLFDYAAPPYLTPEEKLEKVQDLLNHFVTVYAENAILKEASEECAGNN